MDDEEHEKSLKWGWFALVGGIYALVVTLLLLWRTDLAVVGVLVPCAIFAAFGTLLAARSRLQVTPKLPIILSVLGLIAQIAPGPRWVPAALGGAAFAIYVVYFAQNRYRDVP